MIRRNVLSGPGFRKHGYTTAQIGKWHTGIDSGYGRDWDHQLVWSRPKYPQNAGNYFDDQIIEANGKKQRISGYKLIGTDRAIDLLRGKIVTRNLLRLVALLGAVRPFTPADRHRNSYPDAVVPEPADIYPDQPTEKAQIWRGEIAVCNSAGYKAGFG